MRDDGFTEFVESRWSTLVRWGYLFTGDVGRAEDLAQLTLEKVHKHWGRIEKRDTPERYARAAMANLAISAGRRRRFRETGLAAGHDRPVPDGVQDLVERDVVWQALRLLPPRMRAVLVLRFYEDLSEAETARVLGCSVGTVKSQTSRGLDRLRGLLGEDAAPPVVAPVSTGPSTDRPDDLPPDLGSPGPIATEGIVR